mmetsp:Transcript_23170/g.34107  ORF Transcript_23170/g.34107 Transcript_23170/m.34107 type:complete len:85 (-) Transcript_23170:952-1206(-)
MPQDNKPAKNIPQTTFHPPQSQPQPPMPMVATSPAMPPTPIQNASFHNNNVHMILTQHQMINQPYPQQVWPSPHTQPMPHNPVQ